MTEEILKKETKETIPDELLDKEAKEKLTPEELKEIKDKIAFPRKKRIAFRGVEIYIKPLPLSYCMRAFKNLEAFRTSLVQPTFQMPITDQDVSDNSQVKLESDFELAEALINTFKVLVEFYKVEIKDDQGNIPENIEDVITLQEILPLLEAQLGMEDEQNFLFFPWRAMLLLTRFSKEFSTMNQIKLTDQNQ